MNDTPEHIRKLQLKIWLQKSPGERLYQALKSNEELFLALKKAKQNMKNFENKKDQGSHS